MVDLKGGVRMVSIDVLGGRCRSGCDASQQACRADAGNQ
jgi:hypothetical protein